jgi:hypothetical protein
MHFITHLNGFLEAVSYLYCGESPPSACWARQSLASLFLLFLRQCLPHIYWYTPLAVFLVPSAHRLHGAVWCEGELILTPNDHDRPRTLTTDNVRSHSARATRAERSMICDHLPK